MLPSLPHGDDSTLCAATCVESMGCAVSVDMTEPEADKAGIAIDAQGGTIPLAIPWIGSTNRSNQERVARTRRSMAQYRSVTASTLLPDEVTAAIRTGLVNVRVVATHPQHPPLSPVSCLGGQGTVPYEQNTQQSPAAGRSSTAQPSH